MEKKITVIPATVEHPKHLKVAAYCRVSTEHEEQTASLKHQAAHFGYCNFLARVYMRNDFCILPCHIKKSPLVVIILR